jgi:hypothetical protein
VEWSDVDVVPWLVVIAGCSSFLSWSCHLHLDSLGSWLDPDCSVGGASSTLRPGAGVFPVGTPRDGVGSLMLCWGFVVVVAVSWIGFGGAVACTWGCTPIVVYFVLHLLFVLFVICTGL